MPVRLYGQSGELAGTEFLIEEEATIGRRPDNDIVLPFDIVSSRHARIYFDSDEGDYFLEDLNSYNGTRIDGQRVQSAIRLKNEQSITFANAYVFVLDVDTRVRHKEDEAVSLANKVTLLIVRPPPYRSEIDAKFHSPEMCRFPNLRPGYFGWLPC